MSTPRASLAKAAGMVAEEVVRARKLTRAEMDAIVILLRECEKSLLDAEPEQGWHDISTAPKKTRVLVNVPDREHFIAGVFTAVLIGERWMIAGGCGALPTLPTHWKPMPPRPEKPRG